MLPVLAIPVFCIATWASALNDPSSGKKKKKKEQKRKTRKQRTEREGTLERRVSHVNPCTPLHHRSHDPLKHNGTKCNARCFYIHPGEISVFFFLVFFLPRTLFPRRCHRTYVTGRHERARRRSPARSASLVLRPALPRDPRDFRERVEENGKREKRVNS